MTKKIKFKKIINSVLALLIACSNIQVKAETPSVITEVPKTEITQTEPTQGAETLPSTLSSTVEKTIENEVKENGTNTQPVETTVPQDIPVEGNTLKPEEILPTPPINSEPTPDSEPTPPSTIEPTLQPSIEPTLQPTVEPTPQPTQQPNEMAQQESVDKPQAEPQQSTNEPSAMPVEPVVSQRGVSNVTTFATELVLGAENVNGNYIWKPVNSKADHKFIFRVNYSIDASGVINPEEIKMTIPKGILKDKKGRSADSYEMSVPSRDEIAVMNQQELSNLDGFAYYELGNQIVVYNFKELNAINGYFEVAYITSDETFNYPDFDNDPATPHDASNEFYADLWAKGVTQDIVKQSERTVVYIDTTATLDGLFVYVPKRYSTWQNHWGPKPADADQYQYLVWEVRTNIDQNITSAYDLTFKSEPTSPNGAVENWLYKFSGEDYKPATESSTIVNKTTSGYRYDYFVTRHSKATFDTLNTYTIDNKISVTLTPLENSAEATTLTSTKTFNWTKPIFTGAPGNFKIDVVANENWHKFYGVHWDFARYDLEKLQNKQVPSLSDIKYNVDMEGFPFKLTLKEGGDATNPYDFGYTPIKYSITDDTFYLLPEGSKNYVDEVYDGNEEGTIKLSNEDYDIQSIKINTVYRDIDRKADGSVIFNEEEQKFIASVIRPENENIEVFVKVNDAWIKASDYNPRTKTGTTSAYVTNITDGTLIFADGVDGYRLETVNNFYGTNIVITPMVELISTANVDGIIANQNQVTLKNAATVDIFKGTLDTGKPSTSVNKADYIFKDTEAVKGITNADTTGTEHYGKQAKISGDHLIRSERASSIKKQVTSTKNIVRKKQFAVTWYVNINETITTGLGTQAYLKQDNGTFFDLLPVSSILDINSISIRTEKGLLDKSAYTVELTENYKGSGRTLVKIFVNQQAEYFNVYYDTIHDWDSIKDYGRDVLNPVAYKTGNLDIANGSDDNGGTLSAENKKYMTDLTEGTDGNTFIYDETKHGLSIILSATTGLIKKVKSDTDTAWFYETIVDPEDSYSYQIRYQNTFEERAKNLIIFDSLENYTDGTVQDTWQGTVTGIDLSHLREKGINPVIYVSSSNVDIPNNRDLTNTAIWTKWDGVTYDNIRSIAIDCRTRIDGTEFMLAANDSLKAVIYMKAPKSVTNTSSSSYPVAKNNAYIQNSLINERNEQKEYFINYDSTTVKFRVSADFAIKKVDADNPTSPIQGIKFKLFGTSDYGTKVEEFVVSGKEGIGTFNNIEQGTYILQEYEGNQNWQEDHTEHKVVVDSVGNVTVNGSPVTLTNPFIITNKARSHADVKFIKKDLISKSVMKDVKFKLMGVSGYGNEVLKHAVSDANGVVLFPNLEFGSYSLYEVATNNGYVLPNEPFRVTVDENNNFDVKEKVNGVYESILDKTGQYVLYNEPLHSLRIVKRDSYSNEAIGGAKFRLFGTSNNGNTYDKEVASTPIGFIDFDNLEAGTYILQETFVPVVNGISYILDNTKHLVDIKKNGTMTIDGETPDKTTGNFTIFNNRNKQQLTIKKIWNDDLNNSQRKEPVIKISTQKPVHSLSRACWRNNFDATTGLLYYLDNTAGYKQNITSFERNITLAEGDVLAKKPVRLDKDFDNPNAQYKIYGWVENGAFYWWSNAEVSVMTDASNMIFRDVTNIQKINVSDIDTSEVTNMSYIFSNTGRDAVDFSIIGLNSWNTSKVTNMSHMFKNAGAMAKNFNIGSINNWDTSKVTNMSNMFQGAGKNSNQFTIDLSGWDASNTTDMSNMFDQVGANKINYPTNIQPNTNITNITSKPWYDTSDNNKEYPAGSLPVGNGNVSHEFVDQIAKPQPLTTPVLKDGTAVNSKLIEVNTTHKIKAIEFVDTPKPIEGIEITGLDADGDGGVVGWYTVDTVDNMANVYFSSQNAGQKIIADVSAANMFSDLGDVITIKFNGNLDTSNTTDLSKMFHRCGKLAMTDVETFNTEKVTSIYHMFSYCYLLEMIDFSTWKTPHLTNIGSLFFECNSLKKADMRNIDVSNVTKMSSVFQNCYQMTYLDVTGWNTSKATTFKCLFQNVGAKAISLTFKGYEDFDTRNVTTAKMAFFNFARKATIIPEINLSKWDFSKVIDIEGMFFDTNTAKIRMPYNISKNVNTTTSTGVTVTSRPWHDITNDTVYPVGSLPLGFTESHVLSSEVPSYNMIEGNLFNEKMKAINAVNPIKSIEFVDSSRPISSTEIKGLDSNNTGNVVGWYTIDPTDNKAQVFVSSQKVGQKIEAARHSENMFLDLASLETVKFNGILDTSSVAYMSSMFSGCTSLVNVDVDRLDVSRVKEMREMFSRCSALTQLDLTSWKTLALTSMTSMFYGCEGLQSLDLKNFDVSKVTNLSGTFQNCFRLAYLDITGWNTASLTKLNTTFHNLGLYASNIELKGYENFNTSKVTSARHTFYSLGRDGANNLILDLSKWDFSLVTEMKAMFYGTNAHTIKTPINIPSTVIIVPGAGEDGVTSKVWYDETDGYKEYASGTFPIGNGAISHTLVDTKPVAGPTVANLFKKINIFGSPVLAEEFSTAGSNYDPDGKPINWVKNGNVWTYDFYVSDPDAVWFAWEESSSMMEGFTSDHNEHNAVKLEDRTATINNYKAIQPPTETPNVIKLGNIDVKKIVNPNTIQNTFVFTLTLKTTDPTLRDVINGTKVFGSHVFNNGVTTFSLKGGNIAHFTDIPAGLEYEVTERLLDGFDTVITNERGTIVENTTATVVSTSTQKVVSKKPVDIILTKKVEGHFEVTDDYSFSISLLNLEPQHTYTLSSGQTFTSDMFGNADVMVKLGNGGSIVLKDIPAGARYKVTEEGGKYTSSFRITDAANLGKIATTSGDNKAQNSALSTDMEITDEGEQITVAFTNYKEAVQNIKLVNTVTGSDLSGKYQFVLNFSNLTPHSFILSTTGKISADEYGNASLQTELANGEKVEIYDVPVGTKYQFKELPSGAVSSYQITDVNNKNMIVNPSKENTVSRQSLITELETVNEGEEVIVTFINATTPASIDKVVETLPLITKEVVDENGNPISTTDVFKFKINEEIVTISGAGVTTPKTIEFSQEGDYVYNISEVNPGDGKWDYDTSKYVVTYSVYKENGLLKVNKVIMRDGKIVNSIVFRNQVPSVLKVSVIKSANIPPDIKLEGGREIVYNLEIKNVGNKKVPYMALKDMAPKGTTAVSANGGVVGDKVILVNGGLESILYNLEVNEVRNVKLTVKVNNTNLPGTKIKNTAKFDILSADPVNGIIPELTQTTNEIVHDVIITVVPTGVTTVVAPFVIIVVCAGVLYIAFRKKKESKD